MPLPLIVLEAGLRRKITDTDFANLEDLSLSVRGDGIGTIDFTPSAVLERLRNDQIVDLRTVNFYDIEDARHQLWPNDIIMRLLRPFRDRRSAAPNGGTIGARAVPLAARSVYQRIEAQHEQMRSDPISTSPHLIVALSATAPSLIGQAL